MAGDLQTLFNYRVTKTGKAYQRSDLGNRNDYDVERGLTPEAIPEEIEILFWKSPTTMAFAYRSRAERVSWRTRSVMYANFQIKAFSELFEKEQLVLGSHTKIKVGAVIIKNNAETDSGQMKVPQCSYRL